MRRIGIVLIMATAVVLGGCAALAADPPESDATTSESGDTAIYLEHVRTTWTGAIPSDSTIVDYGELACAQLRAGQAHDSIVVLETSDLAAAAATANTRSIVDAAALSLCPEASVN